jgi:hypothetical protein
VWVGPEPAVQASAGNAWSYRRTGPASGARQAAVVGVTTPLMSACCTSEIDTDYRSAPWITDGPVGLLHGQLIDFDSGDLGCNPLRRAGEIGSEAALHGDLRLCR